MLRSRTVIAIPGIVAALTVLLWKPGSKPYYSGEFVPASALDCRGRVELVEGKILLLRELQGCGDQPIQILLLASTNARDDETVESTMHIVAGTLTQRRRDVEIRLAPETDVTRYRAVALWDAARRSNLATAPLR